MVALLLGVGTLATIVALFPTLFDQQRFLSSEARLRARFGRRQTSENHPALKQVDRLLVGRPDHLEVPISGLPDRLEKLFSIYEDLFELRDYRVKAVDRRLDDLWIARIERAHR